MNKKLLLVVHYIKSYICYIIDTYINRFSHNKILYELQDYHKNKIGQKIIVAKIINSPRSVFQIPAIDLAVKRKDILSGFSIDDIVSIVSLISADKEVKIVYNKPKGYKYCILLAMAFGSMLITSNVAASKLISILNITMTGGSICYPLTYVLGSIITEVYGYKMARQLIWGAIICNILFILFVQLTIIMPSSVYWSYQGEYALILGAVPRIIIASLIAYWCGEFVNSYLIAKIKIAYSGKNIFMRILSSSVIGITIDTLIFINIAYTGVMHGTDLILFTIGVYIKKVICEILTVPLTVWLSNKLKKIEYLDIIDYNTNFTPFSLEIKYTDLNNSLFRKMNTKKTELLH